MLFDINDVKLQSQTSRVVRCGQVCRTHTLLPLLQKTSNNVRLGMINNPSAAPSAQTTRVARAIWAAMQTQSANNAKNFITKLTKEETAVALESGTDIAEFAVGVGRGGRVKIACYVFKNTHSLSLPPPQGMDVALFKEAYEDQKFDFLLSHAAYCRDVLKLKKGQTAVISNGRVSHGRAMPDKYSLKKKKQYICLSTKGFCCTQDSGLFSHSFIHSFIFIFSR